MSVRVQTLYLPGGPVAAQYVKFVAKTDYGASAALAFLEVIPVQTIRGQSWKID